MKSLSGLIMAMGVCISAQAEMRAWELRSGETVQGEYVATVFDKAVLHDIEGKRLYVPLDTLTPDALDYIELINPPELTVDLLKSVDQEFVKPSPIWVDNSPVNILRYTFGARIRQKSTVSYRHPLVVELYAVARQVYDPDKYHLIFRWRSEPFMLTAENGRRCEIHAPRAVDLAEFRLAGVYPRGEEFAESMAVIRDVRGEVVACNSSKKWLLEQLGQIDTLPVGAWFDKKGRRVHPTSPKPVWFD